LSLLQDLLGTKIVLYVLTFRATFSLPNSVC
jgi:hypothetical protein